MYERFFQFRFRPFSVLPDSDRIFWTNGYRNAFSVIEVGLDRLSQVTVLTGGIGTGKTTLIRHLLQTASLGFSVGLLSNFAGERGDLLPWVLSAFGLNISGAPDAILFRRLERYFAGELGHGRRSVLIIDEAQNLSEQDLENLRLLSNLNAKEVLMMLVLVGQPQLRAKMTRSENKRLCQRIGADYHLEPLTRAETSDYVRYKCICAGGSTDLFDPAALDEVHRISNGVPRKINMLCDLSLISAYADGVRSINARVIQSVVEDARRHGTYTSLTEHDIVALTESRMVVGGDTEDMAPPEGSGSARDPLQRLTLLIEAGRAGKPVAPVAAEGSAPPARNNTGNVNALFDLAWSDDALLFVDDTVDRQRSAPAAERTFPARGDLPANGPTSLPAQAHVSAGPSTARRPAGGSIAPGRFGQAGSAVAGASHALGQPERLRSRSPTGPSTADAAEAGLRRAFAPPVGWRRMGWRGTAGFAALAASGSMAAGLAIALLPGGSPLVEPRSGLTEPLTVATGIAPELPPVNERPVAANAAAGPRQAPAMLVAAGIAAEESAPGNLLVAARQVAPIDGTAPQSSAADWAAFAPVVLSYQERPGDVLATSSADAPRPFEPASVQAGARLAGGPHARDSETAGSGRSSADHHPVRFGHPLGLGLPGAASDEALASLDPGSARLPSGRLDDASAFATVGAVQSMPAVAAAAHPVRGRSAAAPLLEAVDPADLRSGFAGMNAASGVQALRASPARPTGPALQEAAGFRNPAEVAMALDVAAAGGSDAPPLATPVQAGGQQDSVSAAFDPEATFRHALDIAIEDPRAAVIGFARAAMLGHGRAAYYLGQIYETGDGVPVDFAIARHWYEASSAGNSRAQRRLAELPPPEKGGEVAPPLALLAEPSGTGYAEFVWTSAQGADPTSYVVELSTDPRRGPVAAYLVTGSAARLPLVEQASYWRVVALDDAGSRPAASEWLELARPDESAAAAARPAGHL